MSSRLKIARGAVVCAGTKLDGYITIGARTVIHPRALIIAEAGPIVIGEGNLIEEQSTLYNRLMEGEDPASTQRVMTIGNNNVFEVGSYCEAVRLGDNNILEAKTKVGHGVELTNGCIIGAGCCISNKEIIPENTVISGSQQMRRLQLERPAPQTLQLDFLTKILPNHHHLIRSSKPKI
ncbi:PREDICTED: dynactin subunit 6-like isoform X1 [Priapulus caudatus]|uniref:Dynactin subunit 6 n=1 Tax=Priapulus caudatus TaxID=37621 RepID=A0ABM1EGK0_PRICU|nr:PREDICTED: dynactin subunit 6-like isoform X1 [Priapulus caudatus]